MLQAPRATMKKDLKCESSNEKAVVKLNDEPKQLQPKQVQPKQDQPKQDDPKQDDPKKINRHVDYYKFISIHQLSIKFLMAK